MDDLLMSIGGLLPPTINDWVNNSKGNHNKRAKKQNISVNWEPASQLGGSYSKIRTKFKNYDNSLRLLFTHSQHKSLFVGSSIILIIYHHVLVFYFGKNMRNPFQNVHQYAGIRDYQILKTKKRAKSHYPPLSGPYSPHKFENYHAYTRKQSNHSQYKTYLYCQALKYFGPEELRYKPTYLPKQDHVPDPINNKKIMRQQSVRKPTIINSKSQKSVKTKKSLKILVGNQQQQPINQMKIRVKSIDQRLKESCRVIDKRPKFQKRRSSIMEEMLDLQNSYTQNQNQFYQSNFFLNSSNRILKKKQNSMESDISGKGRSYLKTQFSQQLSGESESSSEKHYINGSGEERPEVLLCKSRLYFLKQIRVKHRL